MKIEVCCNSVQSAINAFQAGADRVEICSALALGGLTPSHAELSILRAKIDIPIHVLIRPREGNFTYSDIEKEIILKDIEYSKSIGCDAVVFGALTKEYELDLPFLKEVMSLAKPLKFTFHRAFDWVNNPLETLKTLNELKVDWVLSSGQKPQVVDGLELLKKMKKESSFTQILPGAGINGDNILIFKEAGFNFVHLTARHRYKVMDDQSKVPMSSADNLPDYLMEETSTFKLQLIKKLIE